jgi:hypothetical protein
VGVALSIVAPGVLGNDLSPSAMPLQAVSVQGGAHGNVTLAGDGSFVYRPAAGFAGSDVFTYRATDGKGTSDVTPVTVVVGDAADGGQGGTGGGDAGGQGGSGGGDAGGQGGAEGGMGPGLSDRHGCHCGQGGRAPWLAAAVALLVLRRPRRRRKVHGPLAAGGLARTDARAGQPPLR